MDQIRKIIHVDMDAFFAAVEERDNPSYRGKPVIVGAPPHKRGVVSTCNYIARKYGVHSAMPSSQAYRLCPNAIFVHGRHEAYREASLIIKDIFRHYTDIVQSVSIDEAYLDVTNSLRGFGSATAIATQIKKDILKATRLTASAGVSYNKFLAKIGSDLNKPNGLVVIPPKKALNLLASLPIGKFHGVGKVTQQKMQKLGINNGGQLRRWSLEELIRHFGKAGQYYYNVARGIDNRPVRTEWVRKSLGKETTFEQDIDNQELLRQTFARLCQRVSQKLQKEHFAARTVTIKLRYSNFALNNRSLTLDYCFNDYATLYHTAYNLFTNGWNKNRKLRLVGVATSGLTDTTTPQQLYFNFWTNLAEQPPQTPIAATS